MDALDQYRGGLTFSRRSKDERGRARAAAVDRAMAASRLPRDVEVWRGMRSGQSVFGPRRSWPKDLTGFEWTDEDFPSTSTSRTVARKFTTGSGGGLLMRIVVPEGTGAVQVSESSFESEILLQRGLRFRVVRDRGNGPDELPGSPWEGLRVVDVEIVPAGDVGGPKPGKPAKVGELTAARDIPLVDASGKPVSDRDRPPSAQYVEVTKVDADGNPVEAKVLTAAEIQQRRAKELKALQDPALQARVRGEKSTTAEAKAREERNIRRETARKAGLNAEDQERFVASGMNLEQWRATRPRPPAPTPRSEVPTTIQTGNFLGSQAIRDTPSVSEARRRLERMSDTELEAIAVGGDVYIRDFLGHDVDLTIPRTEKVEQILSGLQGYRMRGEVKIAKNTTGEFEAARLAADRAVGKNRAEDMTFPELALWLKTFAAEARKHPDKPKIPSSIIVPRG